MRWEESIDLEAGTLTIKPRKGSAGIAASDTKTNASQRTVPLFLELKAILLEHKQNSGYVVFSDRAERYPFKMPWQVEKVRDGLGIKWFSFHMLRHTFASLLLHKCVAIADVARLLGHSNVQITYNTYFHLIPGTFHGISLTNGISPK